MRFFASDNAAGAHPEVLDALVRANTGHAVGYGHDPWTERATARLREAFGADASVTFVFGGTGANVVGLSSLVRPFDAILCARSSHLWRDECGGPEHVIGCKLEPIETPDGKLRPEQIVPFLEDRKLVHRARPRVVAISQPTEWGTVYRPEELQAISSTCRAHDLFLYVDGARLANAAASLGASLADAAAGADILSFGGTKNGLLFGEALIAFPSAASQEIPYHQKQCLQLPSKMRFVAAQFEALLEGELWRRSAAHANAQAQRLAEGLSPLPGAEIVQPVETNVVFARLPLERIAPLQERFPFAVWEPSQSIVRIMTSFDTTGEDVEAFVCKAEEVLQ
ncbi:MAG: beta-eliminating lyase-related protein [Planctomycetota bacterium]